MNIERMRFGPDELTLRDHEGNVTLDGAAEQAGEPKKAWIPTDAEMASLLGREGEDYTYLRTPTTEPGKAQAGEQNKLIEEDIHMQCPSCGCDCGYTGRKGCQQMPRQNPATESRVIPDAIDPSLTPIGYTLSGWYFYADGLNDCLNALNAAPAPTKESK